MRSGISRVVDFAARIRIGFAVVAVLFTLIADRGIELLPWILLVVGVDLGATWLLSRSSSPTARADAVTLIVVGALLAAVAHALGGFPMSPLVLIPAYHGGLAIGRRAIPLVCGSAALLESLVVWANAGSDQIGRHGELAWVLGSIVMVLLGAWSLQLSDNETTAQSLAASEATNLLRRLQELADAIDTGFDAPALGDAALESLGHAVEVDRSGILVTDGGYPVPLSLRGATRFPWDDPGGEDSPLHEAWTGPGTARALTTNEGGVIRHTLAAPLRGSDGHRLGLLVADRLHPAYERHDVAAMQAAADRTGPPLEAAMLFARLRQGAALEERERLAREMHDGLAQDMAALGYQADAVTTLVARGDASASSAADGLRQAIRSTVVDIRTRISDLRMLDRPERSLGALLGAALQDLAATGIRTTLALDEARLRFPADVELQLHRVAIDVLQDARNGDEVTMFTMDVTLHPPYAALILVHDGTTRLRTGTFEDHAFVRGGGSVTIDAPGHRDPVVDVRLEPNHGPDRTLDEVAR